VAGYAAAINKKYLAILKNDYNDAQILVCLYSLLVRWQKWNWTPKKHYTEIATYLAFRSSGP